MKLPLTIFFVLVGHITSAHLGHLRHSKADGDRHLITLDGSVSACIEVKAGSTANGNSFVLGDCSSYDYGIDAVPIEGEGCIDSIAMLQTRLDPTKCMQATHRGKPVKQGSWMRVYPCDANNPLQRFEVIGTIKLENTNWCAAYRGNRPNINQDHIMLRDCDDMDYGWSHD